jgi:hypothetical protein
MPDWKSTSPAQIILSRIWAWWRSLDKPNPWPDELDIAVRAPDAIPVCHHCTTPCDVPVWFCPSCGAAVGPYNNVMPYIYIFSIGEALRSGVGPEAHFTPFRVVAYIVVGFSEYVIFAPIYYICLYMNHRRLTSKQDEESQHTSSGDSATCATGASSGSPEK